MALRLPLGDERLVDEVDDHDEESAGASGGVEDLNCAPCLRQII
jgi:hypothetical protein